MVGPGEMVHRVGTLALQAEGPEIESPKST